MTYGWLLFIYLFGLALGTIIGSVLAKRSKNAASTFCLSQSFICLYAVLSICYFVKDLGTESYSSQFSAASEAGRICCDLVSHHADTEHICEQLPVCCGVRIDTDWQHATDLRGPD